MSVPMLKSWFLALLFAFCVSAEGIAQTTPPSGGTKPSVAQLQGFPAPEAAAEAFTDAIRKDDGKAVAAILGTGWRDVIPGTKSDEDETRANYLKAWDEHHRIVMSGDDKAQIEVGKTGFLMAIPIVKQEGVWRFDVEQGLDEIDARYIGRNELRTIQTLLAIVDAQGEYASRDPMKTGMTVYARRLLSAPGRKDGLYWEALPGEPESPLGPLVAKAQRDVGGEPEGYYGYFYRLLYGQGSEAPGGARTYLVNGRMIGGFGVIAWPVRYDDTGVMTFIVNYEGEVYERDLGPETAQRAAEILLYNPDKSWDKADTTPP